MNTSKKQLQYGIGLLMVSLLAGLLLGWFMFAGSPGDKEHTDHNLLGPDEIDQHVQDAHTDDEGEIVWTCSMHPQIRESEPGNCPICGMELIPARSQRAEAREDDYSMVMTVSAARLADIQTVPVIRETPQKELDLPGRIRVDERRITRVTTHFPGRIRDLRVGFTGAPIRKGEVMATIYSPELITAQRELLEAARQKDRNPRLYESARQKFRLWEFTDEQIQTIEEHGTVQNELEILSPANGYVLSRNIAEEQHVMEGTVIYEVANLDRIWVVLEAYEDDVFWIQPGHTITFRTRNNPGQQFEATVNWIDPVVDPRKRTVGVRADLANPENQLKPDMLVRGNLHAAMDSEKLMVPASSVLWTGPRSLVYIKDTSAEVPRFEVREVELGVRAGDFYVIEEGVDEGEEVVFHGAFRIDSEMQLADRFSMMNREPGRGAIRLHDHGDMEMDDTDMDEIETQQEIDTHGHTGAIDGATDDFREDFKALLAQYLDGKEALFESDMDAVTEAFQQASKKLEAIGMHRMGGDAHVRWMEQYEAIERHLNHILESENMESRHEGFALLSQVLVEAVNNYRVPGVVYHQYCPMEDASWLSRNEQIQNPYAPDTMPSCGEVIERIEL
ncbi:MAG: efflux RND transporter periplasmic adaptor subunit [Cyclonatronaceae bacterium]